MALSVSGFPEPSRHPSDIFSTGEEGNNRNTATSPRILGLFTGGGSTGPSGKKPDSKGSATSVTPAAEAEQPVLLNSSPPTSPVSPLSALKFEPLSQEEYEKQLNLQNVQNPTASPKPSHYHHPPHSLQLPPPRRRTSPSPVSLGVGVARPNYGARSRSPPPQSKLPPAISVEERSTKPQTAERSSSAATPSSGASLSGGNRPLPSVPDRQLSGMASASSDPGLGGSSRFADTKNATGPSKHTNSMTGIPKYQSATPGPSNHSNALTFGGGTGTSARHSFGMSGRASSPSSPPTAPTTALPSSKVLISPARTRHRQNSPSVSMRFQPMVDPSHPDPVGMASTSADTSTDVAGSVYESGTTRPLPRIPPSSAGFKSSHPSADSSGRFVSPGPKARRPRTSPSSISGFPQSTSSSTNNGGPSSSSNSNASPSTRGGLESIPSSWASRPVDLSSSRPNSPPVGSPSGPSKHHHGLSTSAAYQRRPPPLKNPRARSVSRTRRDRSLDAYSRNPLSSAHLRNPPGSAVSVTFGGNVGSGKSRVMPSPAVVAGGRPLAKRPSVHQNHGVRSGGQPVSPSEFKQLYIQTSLTPSVPSASSTSSASGYTSGCMSTSTSSASLSSSGAASGSDSNVESRFGPNGRRLPTLISPPSGASSRGSRSAGTTPTTTPIATVPPKRLPLVAKQPPLPSTSSDSVYGRSTGTRSPSGTSIIQAPSQDSTITLPRGMPPQISIKTSGIATANRPLNRDSPGQTPDRYLQRVVERPLHTHPFDAGEAEALIHPQISPIDSASIVDSPLEFVQNEVDDDDADVAGYEYGYDYGSYDAYDNRYEYGAQDWSRSPSPIQYALPSDGGESDWEDEGAGVVEAKHDEDDASGSGAGTSEGVIGLGTSRGRKRFRDHDEISSEDAGSSRASSPDADLGIGARRRKPRTQLRAYRKSYRGRTEGAVESQPAHMHVEEGQGSGDMRTRGRTQDVKPTLAVQGRTAGQQAQMEAQRQDLFANNPASPFVVTPIMAARVSSVEREAKKKKEKEEKKKKKREKEEREKEKDKDKDKKELWSYFSDFNAGPSTSVSAPGTRASSPERKSRPKQSRRLADAVSLALGGGNRSSAPAPASGHSSGQGSISGLPYPPLPHTSSTASAGFSSKYRSLGRNTAMEFEDVLDISFKTESRRNTMLSNTDSGSSVSIVSESKLDSTAAASAVMATDTTSVSTPITGKRATKSGQEVDLRNELPKGSLSDVGTGTVPTTEDEDENEAMLTPFMWVSRDKPVVTPSPLIPPPPSGVQQGPQWRQRVNSRGPDSRPNTNSYPVVVPAEVRSAVAMQLPQSPSRIPMPSTVTSTVSVGRTTSSTTGAFTPFGLPRSAAKNKEPIRKQRTVSVPIPYTGAATASMSVPKSPPASSSAIPLDDEDTAHRIDNDAPFMTGLKFQKKEGSDSRWVTVENNAPPGDGFNDHQGVSVMKTTRLIHHDGELWEEQQEADLSDIIPKLRSLKAGK